jgi:hypothetical protein
MNSQKSRLADGARPEGQSRRTDENEVSVNCQLAINRLGEIGCDRQVLMAWLSHARKLPGLFKPMGRRKLLALIKKVKVIRRDLDHFWQTRDGLSLFPPIPGFSSLPQLFALLDHVDSSLSKWLDESKSRDALTDASLAWLCAYVRYVTRGFHDRHVASMWNEFAGTADQPKTEEAVRAFRQRHGRLIAQCLSTLEIPLSAGGPPAPGEL